MSEQTHKSHDTTTSVVKLVTLGDVGTGKTTLCQAVCGKPTEIVTAPTLGIDFWSKVVHHNHTRIRLNVYDTSGQERFQALTPSYLRTADIVLLVVSSTLQDKDMAQQLKTWYQLARDNVPATAQYIVAVTKQDLVNGTIIVGSATANQLVRCGLKRYHVVTGKNGFNGAGVPGLWDDVVQGVIDCCSARNAQRVQSMSVQLPANQSDKTRTTHNAGFACLPCRRTQWHCC